MRFRINRLYYWLDRRFRFKLIGWLAAFAAFILLAAFAGGAEEFDVPTNIVLLVLAVIYIIASFLRLPKEFTVENGEMYVVQYLKRSDLDDLPYRKRKNQIRTRKTYVTVRYATRIEYTQSAHEISRNMGRVLIFGTFLTGDKYGNINDVYKPLYVELYGIKDFSNAAAELRATFPDAEHV